MRTGTFGRVGRVTPCAPILGVGNQLCFWCGFPEFHIAMRSRHHSFSTKAKARNKVVFMEKITPHGAVEEQC
jgi:hypothetical protein